MKRQLFLLGLLAVALSVTPAVADPIIVQLTTANTLGLGTGPYGTVSLDINNTGVITVDVTMFGNWVLFGQDAFGFNVVGQTTGVTITPTTSGITVGANKGGLDGFGKFQFALDDGQPPWLEGHSTLSFTVSRSGTPFGSATDLLGFSTGGSLGPTNFAGHTALLGCGTLDKPEACDTGFVGTTPIPEPSTAILLGSGLLGAASFLKRKLRAKKATIS